MIAVNCAIRLCPEADALYAGDWKWWNFYRDDWRDFAGLRFSLNTDAVRDFGCLQVPTEAREGLGHWGVATYGNSGYQAVNLAYLMGAKRICLVGFDMQAKGGVNHFHGNHRGATLTNPSPRLYGQWIAGFAEGHRQLAAVGVGLVNCSRETALTIPRAPLCSIV